MANFSADEYFLDIGYLNIKERVYFVTKESKIFGSCVPKKGKFQIGIFENLQL